MRILLFIFGLFLFSCTSDTTGITFDKQKMTDVLVEMHIAESAVTSAPKDSMELKRQQYMLKIAQIFETTEQEIKENVSVLQKNPDRLKAIYAEVVEILKKKKEDNKKEQIKLK